MQTQGLQQWFCLREGRRNFQIDPVQDREYLFGDQNWEKEIDDRLKTNQLLGTPLRLLWWGQYGIGKTHRLRHIEHLTKTMGYPYRTVYVAASDIQEKTGFEKLHYELVNALGKDHMQSLTREYVLDLQKEPGSLPTTLDISRNVTDVESALKNFGSDNPNLILPAWRFLCGLELKGTELQLAGVTKSGLETSQDFAAVLSAMATIIQHKEQRELIFLIDECENIQKVTNKTSDARWQESLRATLDIQNLGMVLAVGADRFDGMPKILIRPDIVRRMQKDNYVQMDAFKPRVAQEFVRGLLSKWIDPEKRGALEKRESLNSKYPDYVSDLFPFTQGGFDKFCEWSVIDVRSAKPSEIIAHLNKIAADAFFAKKQIIDKTFLLSIGIA